MEAMTHDHRTPPTASGTVPAAGVPSAGPPRGAARPGVSIQAYRRHDEAAVRRIWRSTLALGASAAGLDPARLAAYEQLSLGWYLAAANRGAGRSDVVVVRHDGAVVGYMLVCLDQAHHERWAVPTALRWAAGEARRWRSHDRRMRTFVRLRVHDAVHARRRQPPAPFPAHVHVNLDRSVRGASIGHRLVSWADCRVGEAGHAGYCGEMNVPVGRSLRAVEASGARVVARVPNRTISWLSGRPVERCLVARALDRATDAVPT